MSKVQKAIHIGNSLAYVPSEEKKALVTAVVTIEGGCCHVSLRFNKMVNKMDLFLETIKLAKIHH